MARASPILSPAPNHRKGAGLPLFGKSFTYAASRPNSRIDFQFDNAAFHFRFLPFTIPYPVPFRLLGDETKVCGFCLFQLGDQNHQGVVSGWAVGCAFKCVGRRPSPA